MTVAAVEAARLTVPPGSPDEVSALAGALRQLGAEISATRDRLATAPAGWAPGWQGVTAESTGLAVAGLALSVGSAVSPLEASARALDRWAGALDDAQTRVRGLQDQAEQAAQDAARRRAAVVDELSAARAVPVTAPPPLLGGPPSRVEQLQYRIDRLDVEAAAEQDAFRRRADAVADDLDTVAFAVRRELEGIRPPVFREHRESLSDWKARAIAEALSLIPGTAGHEATVAAAVWAFMTAPQFAVAGYRVATRAAGLVSFLRNPGKAPLQATGIPRRLQEWSTRVPWVGAAIGEGSVGARLVFGVAAGRSLPLWTAVGQGVTAAGDAGLAAKAFSVTTHVGGLRAFGVVGGVAQTGVSLVNVVAQGNPVEAFKASGAGYVADLAEVGFNASTTAFLIAPNPVTAGAVVVTGAVWAGAELVDHWDDVTRLTHDGLRTVNDATDATLAAAASAGRTVAAGAEAAGRDVADTAKTVGGWLNPFD